MSIADPERRKAAQRDAQRRRRAAFRGKPEEHGETTGEAVTPVNPVTPVNLNRTTEKEVSGALNPVIELRNRLEFTRNEFAQVLGVGYSVVVGLELGYALSIPGHILATMGAASGVSPKRIQQRYWRWRIDRGQALQGRLLARARGGMRETHQNDPPPLPNRNSDETQKEPDHE